MSSPDVAAEPAALPGGVPHLLRAVERYVGRQGSQFGAAITYFSVLAVVPILMFGFAAAGLVLTVARPDLLLPLADTIADAIGTADPESREQIYALVSRVLANWRSIGVFGLVWALYSGAGWMGNLKNAVRAQWRPAFDAVPPPPGNLALAVAKEWAVNLGQLVLLLGAMAVTFGLAALSTSLADRVLGLVGLADIGWLAPALRLVPVLFSVGAGYLLFLSLYTVLPESREPARTVRRGAVVAALGLVVLQYLSTFLIGRFSANPAFAVFGSVIALMLFLNLFAQLILFMAAWIGTARHPATLRVETAAPAGPTPDLVTPDPTNPTDPLAPPAPAVRPGTAEGRGARTPTRRRSGVPLLLLAVLLGLVGGWWLGRRG